MVLGAAGDYSTIKLKERKIWYTTNYVYSWIFNRVGMT